MVTNINSPRLLTHPFFLFFPAFAQEPRTTSTSRNHFFFFHLVANNVMKNEKTKRNSSNSFRSSDLGVTQLWAPRASRLRHAAVDSHSIFSIPCTA
ncbi:hypothetical protein DFH07DRAFT_411674 [Mycena maculata]|uniref:Uncharacterized protein n=1 Tax=Mycena maculata TaxID=230809 RepID=A0AAD7NI83_9AGAR|nr:hypothetical protein DFH07DRAFT_411674 [Mycena maculata]